MDPNTITVIIIGIIAGIIAGSTGLAAAGAILLGLTFSGIISDHQTILGTTLYTLLPPTVIFGVWDYYKRGKVNFYYGNILIVTILFFTFIGAYLTRLIPEKYLIFLTGCLLLVSGASFIRKSIVDYSK
jgi:uncharacterized membrane protein YfcA